jgi:hypothetical protein
MRPAPNTKVERYRQTTGPMASDSSFGNNGAFLIKAPGSHVELRVIASDGAGWEHVSVSLPARCPSWDEMSFIKSLFWGEEETVIQYHPPASQYVNNVKYCLHLWKPSGVDIPLPPSVLVGSRRLGLIG